MKTTGMLAVFAMAMVLSAPGCKKKGDEGSTRPAEQTEAQTGAEDAAAAAAQGEQTDPAAGAEQDIETEEVSYKTESTELSGYLAYPKGAASVPGVLVVHEWWGHNQYTRDRAEQLAKMGYAALAVDMYGEGKQAEHPEDAKKFSQAVMSDMPEAVARFEAAKKLLAEHSATDPDKISAIGYCFGGAVVLQMARRGMELDVVAAFHPGSLATQNPAKQGDIKGKVFVAHGAADPFVPNEQVEAFKKEMEQAGADLKFEAYEGAKHAFTNPDATDKGKKFELPLEYNQQADEQSWAVLEDMLETAYPAE